jgi:two-component system, response regulator RegA
MSPSEAPAPAAAAARAVDKTILVVDDDDTFRTRLGKALSNYGFSVQLASSHESAVALAAVESPEFAVVDLRMVGPSGLETTKALNRIDPTTKVVVLTGYGSIATAVDAMKSGAFHYLTKPASVQEILVALGEASSEGLAPDTGDAVLSESAAVGTVPSLARVEWEHIQRVLQDVSGNVTQAAKLLGVHRRSLQRKLSKYPARR